MTIVPPQYYFYHNTHINVSTCLILKPHKTLQYGMGTTSFTSTHEQPHTKKNTIFSSMEELQMKEQELTPQQEKEEYLAMEEDYLDWINRHSGDYEGDYWD